MENGVPAVSTDGPTGVRHDGDTVNASTIETQNSSKTNDTAVVADKSISAHKRSLSGGFLARLNFLRAFPDEKQEKASSQAPEDDEDASLDDQTLFSAGGGSAMSMAQKTAKGRKRKGSLRKTALLGTGRLKAEGRERRNSLLQRRPSTKHSDAAAAAVTAAAAKVAADSLLSGTNVDNTSGTLEGAGKRRFSYELAPAMSSSDSNWSDAAQNISTDTAATSQEPMSAGADEQIVSPLVKSPTSQSYGSTTDDDDPLTFSRPIAGHLHHPMVKQAPVPNASSYFQPQSSLVRQRSGTKAVSPLSALPIDAFGAEEEWDYSETEWWGWVVLIVTWIVFVVGMGSCLEVWSWAWDVGQTPYAPPELEDDPTLPIVGYYPALIILSAIMAWVWVVVAWVGMKYFKHAKIQGDDT